MPSDQNKDLYKKLQDLKREIAVLRSELNQIDEQKESAFDAKDKISKQISDSIKRVKEAKSSRNKLTEEVKKLKEQRNQHNEEITTKIKDIKKLNQDKKDIEKKHKIKDNPSHIKEQIDNLELKIETQPMSFDKEKELMKRINALKKTYNEAKKISGVWDSQHKLSKEIDILKLEANKIHNDIQHKAKESQQKHEEVLSVSKEIDDLKVKEEESFKKFIDFKQKFNVINEQLKQKLMQLNELNGNVRSLKAEKFEMRQRRQEEILKNKEQLIEEKMKRGEKLTTEDILVLQSKL